jgi:hypothetical protein
MGRSKIGAFEMGTLTQRRKDAKRGRGEEEKGNFYATF